MKPVTETSVADWVVESIHPFAQDVGSILPPAFEAYARVFHPAGKGEGDEWTPVTWSSIAAANGKVVHPGMQFELIVPDECFDGAKNHRASQPGLWDWAPTDGELPVDTSLALISILSKHTTPPDLCYFAYWSGWGDAVPLMPLPRDASERLAQERIEASYVTGDVYAGSPREFRDVTARFSIPGRDFYLFEGEIREVVTEWDGIGGALPSMWWPADRSWCVATEIDFDSTYVGGSKGCIAELCHNPELEAMPLPVSAAIGLPSDLVNRPATSTLDPDRGRQ